MIKALPIAACMLALCSGLWPASLKAANAANDLFCDLFSGRSDGVLSVCEGPFPGRDANIAIALVGEPPNRVRQLRLTIDSDSGAVQAISLNVRPVIDVETVGILFMDMNFDGYSDLAVMRSLEDGYRYFLYSPANGRFTPSAELDRIAWPEFDTHRRVIRSYGETADGTAGITTYVWNGGRLETVDAE